MGHARGQIIISDKVVGHFEFNATCGNAISYIYDTHDEVQKNWRSGRWENCTCKNKPTSAYIWADYGGEEGFYWEGRVCLECRAIIDNRYGYDSGRWEEDEDGDYSNCGYGDPRRWVYNIPYDGYPLDCDPYPKN